MESIAGLAIVDILRVGLSGLCFLLAFLGYRLIGKEQERGGSPRRGILRIIQVFIASNLLAGILCAISGYIVRSPVPTCTPELVGSYVPDSVFFIVDLEGWQPGGKGPVVVTRTDHVRKITPKNEDYVIPYFTTGDSVRCDPMPGPTRPILVRNNSLELKGRVQYDYRLPIGHQPAGYSEMVTSKFTFPTGFKNPQKEWWQARITYPTKTVAVTIRFPDHKRCKDIAVSLIVGESIPKPITDNPAVKSYDGRLVHWVGNNQAGQTRIQFDWEW